MLHSSWVLHADSCCQLSLSRHLYKFLDYSCFNSCYKNRFWIVNQTRVVNTFTARYKISLTKPWFSELIRFVAVNNFSENKSPLSACAFERRGFRDSKNVYKISVAPKLSELHCFESSKNYRKLLTFMKYPGS